MGSICLATNNEHKIKEIKAILPDGFDVIGLEELGCTEELQETQETLEGNSMQKARYVYQHYNIACIADDTGLEVEALNGAPGVFSARYASEKKNSSDNINLLLKNLENKSNRKARFRTIVTLIIKQEELTFEGILEGEIGYELKGINGFGYDSIFIPKDYGLTLAEMSNSKKNQISHRGIAISKMVDYLNLR